MTLPQAILRIALLSWATGQTLGWAFFSNEAPSAPSKPHAGLLSQMGDKCRKQIDDFDDYVLVYRNRRRRTEQKTLGNKNSEGGEHRFEMS